MRTANLYIVDGQWNGPVRSFERLAEDARTRRRTVADAIETAHQYLGRDFHFGRIEIKTSPIELPSGRRTALVDVIFHGLGYIVSLPTSARFKARSSTHSTYEEFDISALNGAEVSSDGSVNLADSLRVRAVEILPTYLHFEPSELDHRILRHLIAQTNSYYCFRPLHYGLPEYLWDEITELRLLDYSRVLTIQAFSLKEMQGYLEDRGIRVTTQKIADTLGIFGIRQSRRRRRVARATI
jgi:hypothetical protein